MKNRIYNFRKGTRMSRLTEFKPGQIPWNKGIKYERMIGNKHAFQGNKRTISQFRYEACNLLRMIKKCSVCKIAKGKMQMIVHHKNENPRDNRLKNLQKMCRACHARHHKISITKARIKSYE